MEKQIAVLRTHPHFDSVVRSIGAGARENTLIVLLNNGGWFEVEFSENDSGEVCVGYWNIARPDNLTLTLLDFFRDKHNRN